MKRNHRVMLAILTLKSVRLVINNLSIVGALTGTASAQTTNVYIPSIDEIPKLVTPSAFPYETGPTISAYTGPAVFPSVDFTGVFPSVDFTASIQEESSEEHKSDAEGAYSFVEDAVMGKFVFDKVRDVAKDIFAGAEIPGASVLADTYKYAFEWAATGKPPEPSELLVDTLRISGFPTLFVINGLSPTSIAPDQPVYNLNPPYVGLLYSQGGGNAPTEPPTPTPIMCNPGDADCPIVGPPAPPISCDDKCQRAQDPDKRDDDTSCDDDPEECETLMRVGRIKHKK